MSEVSQIESNGLVILAFDPSLLGTTAEPLGRGDFRASRLSAVMEREDVLAAIDGTMFTNCDAGSTFRTLRCADPDYAVLDLERGVMELPNRGNENEGLSLSVVNGRAVWATGGRFDPRASLGVQFYPALVLNGAVASLSSAGSNEQPLMRAAVLGFADGRIGFARGTDSLRGFAERCRAAGAIWAGYTDGSTSTAMALRLPDGSFRRWGMSEQNERPVAFFLVARRRRSFVAPLLIGAAAVIAIGLGVWAIRRRSLEQT